MYVTIPAEEVGAKIVEWYSCIIARSVDQAVLLHTEIKEMLKRMEPSDRMLAYYSLVEYRFTLMRDQTTDETTGGKMLEHVGITVEKSIDHMLHYLYYFVSGQHEFLHERYRSAVKLFRKAERLLEHVNDAAEEADFHYYMGISLQRINQNVLASSYLEEAIVSFKRLGYPEREVYCQHILASIFSEAGNYQKAEEILKTSMSQVQKNTHTEVILIRSLGVNAHRKKDYQSAVHFQKLIIEKYEIKDTIVYSKAKYSLARALFALDQFDEAQQWLFEALKEATYHKNREYILRCKILESLYILENKAKLNQITNELTKLKLHYEVEELSEEISGVFEKKGYTDIALSFLKIALQAKQKNLYLGVDQS
ncbi:response regulator aspartate phosphatase B/response regulator aspartate phosphatase J [Alkalihalobacillus xiaoxiensis]|uniref:Response regulator aspartate phosphatase B/response regulator aspartate phosphatase J n=1 Tax=Shouchella xiaoxiensis TaxID=766895 RepID=A0ABS2SMS2_9BACI|nr:hypothetical protein [Shouchella xiaoxiensis]MBM7836807.1 response regulator aspartate phosphatase B/response regulator aspartate phosphatase J [Shouchella xiaoxiensis]